MDGRKHHTPGESHGRPPKRTGSKPIVQTGLPSYAAYGSASEARSLPSTAWLGMLEGTAEQIIDSTPMLGAAATQDTVRLSSLTTLVAA